MQSSTRQSGTGSTDARANGRLIGLVTVLVLVNFVVDSAITAPLVVLPEMLDHFGTDQAAWLNATAMLAGVMWAPLLGRSADIHGRRKVLVLTLLLSCAGALVCAVAPGLWLFVPGRMLQGASLAAIFLSVAIVRGACAPRTAMIAVGVVTSGSAVLNIASRFLIEELASEFGFQVLFLVSAAVAVAMAGCVHKVVPESPAGAPGRIDFGGALLLGAGLGGVLGYVSLGSDFGWLAVGPLALLAVGVTASARWFLVSSRKPDPLIDVKDLHGPLALLLLVVFLAAGSYQSMLQLIPLIGDVSSDQGLGYGLADRGSTALLLAAPGLGVTLGGPAAGWLAARVGPAPTLAGAVTLGTVVTLGMFLGVSRLPAALCCAFLLGVTVGALGTSGFNMAGGLAPPERQGIVSSLVMVMVSIGSVALNFVGAAVLASTAVVIDGETVNSATGVLSCIAIASGAFTLAAVLAALLARTTWMKD
ncbi:MFS transporter [Streptomyces clavuligerus]|uniref:Arabinose efflux permease family protein n=1 Tax=Streptomyces clavuligerus TaxID=1901 RepID=B5GMB9_STRCL|nr:MFS transporter [Streptomyces clavuligerus]ANW22345.1 MFS transporter [Streptomyces clavuligerus]AXU17245.1 MFS transporter [Streptomyces clavuligerus]EDY47465.1 major facilitator superfamily MFS-1 [Streptomyces clavuligerus]EFG04428.1 Arabinose efflux permease family protein [Streptomyces clavuligerus]MBY6307110.1 MFS transporter [Streptomyces clavuligerus]